LRFSESEINAAFSLLPIETLDPWETGEKAANLIRLSALRLRVPRSWATRNEGIRAFLEDVLDISAKLNRIREIPADFAEISHLLQNEILQLKEPSFWENAAHDWGSPPWIFRSNGNFEDNAQSSFSGGFESITVFSLENSWAAFREVIASFFSPSAITRILTEGLDPALIKPGVLLQPKLEAKISGVCFTRDPNNPWNQNGVLNFESTHTDGVTSGAYQSKSLRRSDAPSSELSPIWSKLWREAQEIEEIFGCAQDLEWLWDGRKLIWLQARPIVGELFDLARISTPDQSWTRDVTEERFPHPVSKLGWTMIADLMDANLATLEEIFNLVPKRDPSSVTVQIRGVIYSDPDFFSFPKGLKISFWSLLTNLTPGKIFSLASALLVPAPLRMLTIVRAFFAAEVRKLIETWPATAEKLLKKIESFNETKSAAQNLLSRMEELRTLSLEFMRPDLSIYILKMAFYQGLIRAVGPNNSLSFVDDLKLLESKSFKYQKDLASLANAFHSTHHGSQILALISQGQIDAALEMMDSALKKRWDAFLQAHGHVTDSWDFLEPALSDRPDQLAKLLLTLNKSTSPQKELKKVSLESKFSEDLQLLLGLMKLDEDHHYDCGLLLLSAKKLLAEVAKEFVQRRWLENEEDLALLSLSEVKQTLKNSGPSRVFLAETRRTRHRLYQVAPRISRFPTFSDESQSKSGTSTNFGASPGQASGQAVPIETFADNPGRISPPVILLLRTPSPAWIPYYRLANGLVCKTGSLLSHGFIAAREYGIPAVVSQEIDRIKPGDWIEMDGDTGKIQIKEDHFHS